MKKKKAKCIACKRRLYLEKTDKNQEERPICRQCDAERKYGKGVIVGETL